MNRNIEKSLLDIDFASLTRGPFTPSPAAWEDQVLYFLMLDRFSDGNEKGGYTDTTGRPVDTGVTPLYRGVETRLDYDTWFRAGGSWQGGTIKGLTSKLGYLRRLGVTALWVSPPFRQVAFEPTYHGYGVQNFLDVDPHFGTREEFRDFVKAAHEQGIYVILDIIAHHTGNVFTYDADRYSAHDASGQWFNDPRWDGRPYAVAGFNDRNGQPTLPFGGPDEKSSADAARLEAAWPDGAVWPREFQRAEMFLRSGRIYNWGHYPEYVEGDMAGGLKTLDVRIRWSGQYRRPSPAMGWLCLAYCFWIAYADLDGFRIDAAKHMDADALRSFCDWIREFAQSIGKERFLLVGEVPGGRDPAWEVMERTGLDATLGIEDIPGKLERMVTGEANPMEYFSIFRNWILDEPDGAARRWYRNQVVTLVDDHDQVRKWTAKCRFCGDSKYRDLAFNVMAVQLTTAGIPCIYFGSEQGFDSGGRPSNSDQFLRENMFGGRFGGLCTQGRHFFNEQSHLYRALASLTALRKDLLTLRRGSQVLHRISGDGVDFGQPRRMGGQRMRSLVCWSRLFLDQETLGVFNTDESNSQAAWSTVSPLLRVDGDQFQLIFWHAPKPAASPATTLTVRSAPACRPCESSFRLQVLPSTTHRRRCTALGPIHRRISNPGLKAPGTARCERTDEQAPANRGIIMSHSAHKNGKLSNKAYTKEMRRLQAELCKLQDWVRHKGLRIVIVFEGRDGAGKGGTIRAITERVSPRAFRVVALPAPTEREKSQMYLQRYLSHFPAAGEVVIFDRSWYNRAGVEYVMGFCGKAEHREFLKICPLAETFAIDQGVLLIKYWLEVSDKEQKRRFEARLSDPLRQWKLSPIDLPSRKRWFDYSLARDKMLDATDTRRAPWHIIHSDDKKRARLNCIRHLLSLIPYKRVPREKVELPKRSMKHAYDDQAALRGRKFVPEKY